MRVAFTKGNFSPNQNKSGFSAPSASVFAPENTEQETTEGKAGCRHRWATPSPAPRAANGGRVRSAPSAASPGSPALLQVRGAGDNPAPRRGFCSGFHRGPCPGRQEDPAMCVGGRLRGLRGLARGRPFHGPGFTPAPNSDRTSPRPYPAAHLPPPLLLLSRWPAHPRQASRF